MKTRRKILLLSMTRYVCKAVINSAGEGRAWKAAAHARFSAAVIMNRTSLCKGSFVKEVVQRIG